MKHFEEALKIDDGNVEAHLNMASIHEKNEDYAKAYDHLKKAKYHDTTKQAEQGMERLKEIAEKNNV